MLLSRSEIREDLLTLEDAALLDDPDGQLPADTRERVRRLVRSDPRASPHYTYLETLADEAEMPESGDRLYVGLRYLEEIERLEQAEGWQHPGEVLDPTGEAGISYPELIKLAGLWARQGAQPDRYRAIERKLEHAWTKEKARNQPAEDFAARLCEVEPAEAERLLRQAAWRYQARQRQAAGDP